MKPLNQGLMSLNPSVVHMAHRKVRSKIKQLFDLDYLQQSLKRITKGTNLLYQDLRKINLVPFFKSIQDENKMQPCIFIPKRQGWISKNENGEYRYFSSLKNSFGYYSFDIIDILSIIFNKNGHKVLLHLSKSDSLHFSSDWSEQQKALLKEDVTIFNRLSGFDYPYLKRMIRGGDEIYAALQKYAEEKIVSPSMSIDDKPVFFLSTAYFKNHFFPSKSLSTLNKWINFFALLGLVQKPREIPFFMEMEAEKQQIIKKKNNQVSFYMLPTLTEERLRYAEKIAKECSDMHLSYYQISKTTVKEYFGEETYSQIYIQQTFGRKKENKELIQLNLSKLQALFYGELIDNGRVNKTKLSEWSELKPHDFNSIWKVLIKKFNCVEFKRMEIDSLVKRKYTVFAKVSDHEHDDLPFLQEYASKEYLDNLSKIV